MTLTFSELDSGNDGTDTDGFTTVNDVAFIANRTYVVMVANRSGSPTTPDTIATTSAGFSFAEVLNNVNSTTQVSMWRATPSSNVTDTLDITWPGQELRITWSIVEIQGSEGTSGNNGSDAFGNTGSSDDSATPAAITLDFVSDADDGAIGYSGFSAGDIVPTEETVARLLES